MTNNPDGWRRGFLRELIIEVPDRVDPTGATRLARPYIGLEHIGQGDGRIVGVGDFADVTSQKSCFQAGDILYGKLRPNLRKVAMPTFDGVCSTDIIVFRPINGTVARFVFHVLQSDELTSHAVATSAGTKMPRTHARSILAFELPVPPADEQQRVADVLDSIDAAIASEAAVGLQSSKVKRDVADTLFSRGIARDAPRAETILGELPVHWGVAHLADLCSSVSVGIASSATHAYRDHGIPLIRNQNIKAGFLDLGDLLYVSPEYDAVNASKRIKAGDILTMRTGYPGRSAVVTQALAGSQTFTTLISRPRPDKVLSEFLCEWINSDRGMRQVRKLQAGGAQQNLNAGVFERFPVPVPPLDEQAAMVDVLASFPLEPLIVGASKSVRSTVRTELLSGSVRAQ